MAKAKKGGGKPFEKGVSGNPNGRPKLDYATLEAKLYTRSAVIEAMHEAMAMPLCDLMEGSNAEHAPYASGAQAMMRSLLAAAILQGCPKRAAFFMSYLFGRPIEYDPKIDDKAPTYKKGLDEVPSEAITKVLNELKSRGESVI